MNSQSDAVLAAAGGAGRSLRESASFWINRAKSQIPRAMAAVNDNGKHQSWMLKKDR
jgi:hypothetical protein